MTTKLAKKGESSFSLKKRPHNNSSNDEESPKHHKTNNNNKSQMFDAFDDDDGVVDDKPKKNKSRNGSSDNEDHSDHEELHKKKKPKKQEKSKLSKNKKMKDEDEKTKEREEEEEEEEEEQKKKEDQKSDNDDIKMIGTSDDEDGLSDYEREALLKSQVPPPSQHPIKTNSKTDSSPKLSNISKIQQETTVGDDDHFLDVRPVNDFVDNNNNNGNGVNKNKQQTTTGGGAGTKKSKSDSQTQGNGSLDKFVTPLPPKTEDVVADGGKEMVIYDTARVKRANDMIDDVKKFSSVDKSIATCINLSKQVMEMSEKKEKTNGTEAPTAISMWRYTLNRESYSSVTVEPKEKSKTANSSHTELNMDALIAGKRSSFMTPLMTVGVSTMTGAGSQPKINKGGRSSSNTQQDGGIVNYGEFSHAITLVSGFVPNDDLLFKYKNLREEQKDFVAMFVSFILLILVKMWGLSNLKAQLKSQITTRYQINTSDLNEMPDKTRFAVLKDWTDSASLPIQTLKNKVLSGQESAKENIITARKTFWPKQDTKNMSGRIVLKYSPFGLPWKLNDENMEYLAKSLSNHYRVAKQGEKAKEIDDYYAKLDIERSKLKKPALTPTNTVNGKGNVGENTPPATMDNNNVNNNKTNAESNGTTTNTANKEVEEKPQVPDVCYSHIIDVNINDSTLTEEKLDPVVWKIVVQRRHFYDMLAEMHSKGFEYDPPQVYTDKPDPITGTQIHLFDINRPERNVLPSGSIVRARIHFRPHSTTQQFGVQAPHTAIYVVRAGIPTGGYAHTVVEESQAPDDILKTLDGVGLKRPETHPKEQDENIHV